MSSRQKWDLVITALALISFIFKMFFLTFIFVGALIIIHNSKHKITAYEKYGTNDLYEIVRRKNKQEEKEKQAKEMKKSLIKQGYDSDDLAGIIKIYEQSKERV